MRRGYGLDSKFDPLTDGEERIFAFLQVDVEGHSQLRGASIRIQKTKENLGTFVRTLIEATYGGRQLVWTGDGGAFVFLVEDPSRDYDNAVTAATHVLQGLSFFNMMKASHNLLQQDLSLRVSCHEGRANWHHNPSYMHGQVINYFLKHEREIGHSNTVTVTEDIYDQLVGKELVEMFHLLKEHEYVLSGQRYTKPLYSYEARHAGVVSVPGLIAFHPMKGGAQAGSMTHELLSDVAQLLRDEEPRRLDVLSLVGTSFFDNPDFRLFLIQHPGLEIRVLLLSPSSRAVKQLDEDLRRFLGPRDSVSQWVMRSVDNIRRLVEEHRLQIQYGFCADPPPWKLVVASGAQTVELSCRVYGRGRGGYSPVLKFRIERVRFDQEVRDKLVSPSLATLVIEDFELRWLTREQDGVRQSDVNSE